MTDQGRQRVRRLPISWLLLIALCGGLGGRAEGATRKRFWPDRARWKQAALHAVRDPGTWVPAGIGLVIAAGGWDDNLSTWATRETPLFGSNRSAARASDDLRTASNLGMIATAFLVPTGDSPWKERVERVGVQQAGAILSTSITSLLKNATDRQRPNGSDRESFPSGHTSRAFAYAGSSSRNLAASRLSRPARLGLDIGLKSLAAGTGWARIEAGAHYPTDVLASAALGSFLSGLLNDAFLSDDTCTLVYVTVDRHGAALGLRVSF